VISFNDLVAPQVAFTESTISRRDLGETLFPQTEELLRWHIFACQSTRTWNKV